MRRVGTGIGQTLDKYELLEKVGQGGMAVVYRGLDTSLRREVAVKVLHHHLAESKEARDRFEREAQAVAKLRHENILEIFDFSGTDSDESYIVTEFIEGQTLKQFITEHDIKYPEIGAMITVQVCRALSHAHSLGVLHRDVKPENVMIRNDGVVKLTDFGIAQMLDHHRLTVTGQLLGSPAYMAPEHIEGGQLDFRTDVFAAGIVLYQLTTGEMPFRGKNPHEILKRIAECTYTDPRQMNPLVGNELRGIIVKALAHDKDDRYADVSQMVAALESYLVGCGLNSPREELARFFGAPVSYEMALRPRLVAALAARGRERLADDRNGALELFNRVLTMDPENREVLEEIDRLSRQRRWVRGAALCGGLLLVVGLAAGARQIIVRSRHSRGSSAALVAGADSAGDAGAGAAGGTTAGDPIGPSAADASAALAAAGDAAPAPSLMTDAGAGATGDPAGHVPHPDHHPGDHGSGHDLGRRDAGPPAGPARRHFTLAVWPRGSEYRIGNGAWVTMTGTRAAIEVGPGDVTISARNSACCADSDVTIAAEEPGGGTQSITLGWLPGSVTPRCKDEGVQVRIDGLAWTLGRPFTVPIERLGGSEKVRVTFTRGTDEVDQQDLDIKYHQALDVSCKF